MLGVFVCRAPKGGTGVHVIRHRWSPLYSPAVCTALHGKSCCGDGNWVLQDVIYIHPLAIATTPQSMLYMICDGHSGVEAANFVAANFLRILNSRLPPRPPPIHSAKGEARAWLEANTANHAMCVTVLGFSV